jgi:hypothetical protein
MYCDGSSLIPFWLFFKYKEALAEGLGPTTKNKIMLHRIRDNSISIDQAETTPWRDFVGRSS